jgi:hypothetical protein
MSQVNLSQLLDFGNVQPNTQVRPESPNFVQQNIVGGQIQVGEPQRVGTNYVQQESSEAAMFFALAEISRGFGQGISNYGQIRDIINTKGVQDTKNKVDAITNNPDLTPEQKVQETDKILKDTTRYNYRGTEWQDAIRNDVKSRYGSPEAWDSYAQLRIKEAVSREIKINPNFSINTPQNKRDFFLKQQDENPSLGNSNWFNQSLMETNIQIDRINRETALNGLSTAINESYRAPSIENIAARDSGTMSQIDVERLRDIYPRFHELETKLGQTPATPENLRQLIRKQLETDLELEFTSNPQITREMVEEITGRLDEMSIKIANDYAPMLFASQQKSREIGAINQIGMASTGSNPSHYLTSLVNYLGDSGLNGIQTTQENLVVNLLRINGTDQTTKNWTLDDNSVVSNKKWSDLTIHEQISVVRHQWQQSQQAIAERLPTGLQKSFVEIVNNSFNGAIFRNKELVERLKTSTTASLVQLELQGEMNYTQDSWSLTRDSNLAALDQALFGFSDPSNPILKSFSFNPDGSLNVAIDIKKRIRELPPDTQKRLESLGWLTPEGIEYLETTSAKIEENELRKQQDFVKMAETEIKARQELEKTREKMSNGFDAYTSDQTKTNLKFIDEAVASGSIAPTNDDERNALKAVRDFIELNRKATQLQDEIDWAKQEDEFVYGGQKSTQKTRDLELSLGELNKTISNLYQITGVNQETGNYYLDEWNEKINNARMDYASSLFRLRIISRDGTAPKTIPASEQRKVLEALDRELLDTLEGRGTSFSIMAPVANPFNPDGTLSIPAIVQLVKLDTMVRLSQDSKTVASQVGTATNALFNAIGSSELSLDDPALQYQLTYLHVLSTAYKQVTEATGSTPIIHDADYFRKLVLLTGNLLDDQSLPEMLSSFSRSNPTGVTLVSRTALAQAALRTREQGQTEGSVLSVRTSGAISWENLMRVPSADRLLYAKTIFQVDARKLNQAAETGIQPVISAVKPTDSSWDAGLAVRGLGEYLGETLTVKQVADAIRKSFVDTMGVDTTNWSDADVVRYGFYVIDEHDQTDDSFQRSIRVLSHPQWGINGELGKVNPNVSKLELFFGTIGAFADLDINPALQQAALSKSFDAGITLNYTYARNGVWEKTNQIVGLTPIYNVRSTTMSPFLTSTVSDIRGFKLKPETEKQLQPLYYSDFKPPEVSGATQATYSLSHRHNLGAFVLASPPTEELMGALLYPVLQEYGINLEFADNGELIPIKTQENENASKVMDIFLTVKESNPKTIEEALFIVDSELKRTFGVNDGLFPNGFKTFKNTESALLVQNSPGTNFRIETSLPTWRTVERNVYGIPRIVVSDAVLEILRRKRR